jgi:alkylhydroperoxidase family enzyme
MQHGASEQKVEAALSDYKKSNALSTKEKLALELCERMTYTDKRVTDEFFDELKRHYTEEQLVELAAIIALENFRSKFNPVFAVESQGFCPLPAVKEVAEEASRRFHEQA